MKNSQTLAQRLRAGRIPVGDALRMATAIAEQVRQVHAQGRTHGALTPEALAIGDSGLELLAPARPGITRYSAPEVVQGQTPDGRSDIFSLGAIIYEIFTGRSAPAGADGLTPAPPSGSPALDRLVANCMAPSPDARFQEVPKIQLGLRLLGSALRRGAPSPVAATVAAAPAAAPALPSPGSVLGEMEALEARISARMHEQERAIGSVECVANEVLKALRAQQSGGFASGFERPSQSSYAAPRDYASDVSSSGKDRAFELLADKLARVDMVVGTLVEKMKKLELHLDGFDTDAAALRDSVTRDVRNFERALKVQNTAIESARTAMGQTDDLVERVVEAIDSLQSMFIPGAEVRAAS